jgi:drug/metabolite transporter (DMT)-like permease
MTGLDDSSQRLRGMALVVLAASMFACVDGISKILAETQSVGQIVWARYALSLPVLVATTPRVYWPSLFRTAHPWLQVGRGLMPMGVSITMVLAVRYLPLAEATTILFLSPFLVVGLSAPLLGERIHPASWIGVVVGFVGVLVVARPGFGDASAALAFPFVAALFFSLFQLVTRGLAARGEIPQTTLAWTLAVGALISTPFAIATWVPLDLHHWLLMIGLGIVFGLAQSFMVRAFTHAPAGLLAPFGYAQIVAAIVFGVVVLDSIPDGWTFIGVAMIIAAGVYVARSQRK